MKNNLLQIKDFSMAFGENILFTNFNIELKPGIYVFSGPSGVGKSTLMRIIAGLETRYTGNVVLNGNEIVKPTPEVHMMHQHYTSFPWLNVLKNTLMVYKGHKIKPTAADIEEARTVLTKLGLGEHLEKLPSQISGGQDQRLSFASALVNKWSPVVLYDEPTSALDMVNDMLVVELIKEHQRKYNTIEIVITHEEHVVEALEATVLEFTPEFRLKPGNPVEVHDEPQKATWFSKISEWFKNIGSEEDSVDESNDENIKEDATSTELDDVLNADEQFVTLQLKGEDVTEPILLTVDDSENKHKTDMDAVATQPNE